MYKKIREKANALGLIFTIISAAFCILSYFPFFEEARLQPLMFDAGVNALGSLITCALFFGCMNQRGDGTGAFKRLVVLVSASFMVNEALCLTSFSPDLVTPNFVCALVSKLVDVTMNYMFYRYVKETLDFKGKLANLAEKILPILLGFEFILLLSNLFYPVTFTIDAAGQYVSTPLNWLESVYLMTTSVLMAILIARCDSPRNQKITAMTFVFFPIVFGLIFLGEFGDASQYAFILMSLVLMYCVIFNEKSNKLAATQTELNMANEIQASMLPSIFPAFPERDEFDLYASMDPAKEVGGDFYDFFMIDNNHIGIVIADVSGKGVPAALFMMISKTIVQNYAMLGIGAAETLTRANAALCAQNKMEMFVTTWVGILELSTGKLDCASAGHEYPAIYHDGKFELFKDKHGLVLGAMDMARYRSYDLQLEKGDKIFVYTDGVPEATNSNNELFGTDRMIEALNTHPEANPKEILKNVRASVDKFVGVAEQFDDLTMVCVEYQGSDAA